ncbi:hypothetical protein RRG08_004712 [Elysia crispata]|uniref:Uncharacterized protein n=1 Tax=Elysia crispata TaxID=231223 RepID=A0AAE1CMW9_9GAST|nr:hypothetical protein RRG08_004712 [Elysia crispata]
MIPTAKHRTRSCKKGTDGSVKGARGFEQSYRSTTLMYSNCICLYCFGFPRPNVEQEAAIKEQMDQCKEQENETKLQNYNSKLAALFIFIAYDFSLTDSNSQTQDKELFPQPNIEQEAARKEQMDQCKEQENETKLQNYNPKLAAPFIFIAYDFSLTDSNSQTQDKELFPQPNVEQEAARKEQMDQCKEQENETKLQNYNPKLAALFVFIAYAKYRTRNHKKGTDGSVKGIPTAKHRTRSCKKGADGSVKGARGFEQSYRSTTLMYSSCICLYCFGFPQPNVEQEAARKEQMDQCKEQENETKLQNYNPKLAALFVFIAYVYIHCTSLQRFLYSEFIDHRFPQPNIEQEAARKEQMDQCKEQENETKLQNYNPKLAALFVFIAYDFSLTDSNSQTQDKELFPQPNVEQEAARKEQMDQCKEQENETKLQNYNPKLAALFVFIAYDKHKTRSCKKGADGSVKGARGFEQSCRSTTLMYSSCICLYCFGFPQPNIEQEAARKEQMDQCKEQENETKLQNYNPKLAALFIFIAYGQELRESNTWTYVRSNRFKQSCRITTLRFKSSFCPYYLGNPQLPGKHTLPTQVMIANSFKWPITRPGEAEKK